MSLSFFKPAALRGCVVAAALALPALAQAPADASTLNTLAGFSSSAGCPTGGLNSDTSGNLYVALTCGSDNGYIIQMSPPTLGNSNWSTNTVWTFSGTAGGASPTGGMAPDGAGGFYGTTLQGGLGSGAGNGTIFHLLPPGVGHPGSWALTTVHFFTGSDGRQPTGGLIVKGSLVVGTTSSGGTNGDGTIWSFNLSSGKFKTLWNFTGMLDGGFPEGGLVSDGNGGFYGANTFGGTSNSGVIYDLALSPTAKKTYTLTPLYSFNGDTDGGFPEGNLVLWNGILYGTCEGGGGSGFNGTVWQLSPPTGGGTTWTYSVIRHLAFADGSEPTTGPVRSGKVLYVASPYGGAGPGAAYGTIDAYKKSGTSFSFTQPVVFNQGNGAYPNSPLLSDGAGGFYGATTGGIFGYGSVFHLTP